MAQFDVYTLKEAGLVLDVQTDLLQGIHTRMVVPLLPRQQAPHPAEHLNPIFDIHGKAFVLMPALMAAVPCTEFNKPMANLQDEAPAITRALDMLFHGF